MKGIEESCTELTEILTEMNEKGEEPSSELKELLKILINSIG